MTETLTLPAGTSRPVSNGRLTCRLCGETHWMRFLHEEKGYHIRECPACGFITTDPIPTDAELAAFYSSHWLPGDNREDWQGPRLPVFEQIAEILRHHGVTPAARVLDIGAAYGAFLQFLQSRGFQNLAAIELSDPAAAHMRKTLNISVLGGDLTTAALPAAAFDVITLLDTFEHLPHFKAIMLEVARVLRPGGLVVVRVPNMSFHRAKADVLQSMQWHSPFGVYTPPGHLNHFTASGLEALFRLADLTPRGRWNGVPDLVGGRKRIAALALWHRFADLLRAASGARCLLGNSMVLTATTPESEYAAL